MDSRYLLVVLGVALAGWGHLLVHDRLGAGAVWTRLDARFPPACRSSPALAGALLLAMGTLCAVLPMAG